MAHYYLGRIKLDYIMRNLQWFPKVYQLYREIHVFENELIFDKEKSSIL